MKELKLNSVLLDITFFGISIFVAYSCGMLKGFWEKFSIYISQSVSWSPGLKLIFKVMRISLGVKK